MERIIITKEEMKEFEKWVQVRGVKLSDFTPVLKEGRVSTNDYDYDFKVNGNEVMIYFLFNGEPIIRFPWDFVNGTLQNYEIRPGVKFDQKKLPELMKQLSLMFLNLTVFLKENSHIPGVIMNIKMGGEETIAVQPSILLNQQRGETNKNRSFPMGVEVLKTPLDLNKSLNLQINGMLDDYYTTWIHQPIPALGGRTPREVSKTPKGKMQLDKLFKEMKEKNSFVPFPEAKIRKELGM